MRLDYSKLNGLVPAIVQDAQTGRVLMLAFMNEQAFNKTLETGYATFYSRSRQKLWTKGEHSGHRLKVETVHVDCDHDAILLRVTPLGPGVCHEGYQSCFFRTLSGGQWVVTEPKSFDPEKTYGERP